MNEPVKFKPKGDYSEHVFSKQVDGKSIEYVNIDAMTDEQFKQYCRDTGAKWFQRFNSIYTAH
jgi:hypothetical protein